MANNARANNDRDLAVEESRVTSLELFFDLVFVFTLTQLTALLATSLSWESLLQSFLIFIVLFWMYGGYVWLTNSVPPVTPGRQLLLIAGMAAFLICALAIPNAFQDTGVAFGIGYLIVILVHASMFVRAVGLKAARFVPMNFLSAATVITAGFADGPARYLLWLLATGIKSSIERLTTRLDTAHAFALGGGVGLYLIGTIIFRRVSGIPEVTRRYVAACLAILTGFIGNNLYAGFQFARLILILIVLILAESDWAFAKQPQ